MQIFKEPRIALLGATIIIFMHLFSFKTTVTPEPGAAFHVYTSYVTIIRDDFDRSAGLKPLEKYQRYFAIEEKQIAIFEEKCRRVVFSDSKKCIGNVIDEDGRLQHFKSYIIPSAIAGLTYSHEDLLEINSLKKQSDLSPSPNLRFTERKSGITFFYVLLLIKLLAFFHLLGSSKSKDLGSNFVTALCALSFYGVVCDKIFSRGSGTYAIDPIVPVSPIFNANNSLLQAAVESLVVAAKSLVIPAPSIAIWGNTPRSAATFVAFVIFVSIAANSNSRSLFLIPLGLGVHFVNFAFQIAVLTTIYFLGTNRKKISVPFRSSLPALCLFFSLLSQLTTFLDSFQLTLIYVFIVLFTCFFCFADPSISTFSFSKRIPLISTLAYVLITGFSIFFYALKFGDIESDGFWLDGFTREASGRVAALINAIFFLFAVWKLKPLVKRVTWLGRINRSYINFVLTKVLTTHVCYALILLQVIVAFPISDFLIF